MFELHVYRDVQQLARAVADAIATELTWAIQQRGIASFAVSGGTTPWIMLTALARHPVDWDAVHLFQVDERVAPDGDPERNATSLQERFIDVVALPTANRHLIDISDDLDASADEYAQTLAEITQGVLDVVHLGLGDDGHTASLVPGDPILDVVDQFVGVTQVYRGHQRISLTYPTLNAARRIVWLTNGISKAAALQQLRCADSKIPAGRVAQEHAVAYCDEEAAAPAQ